MNSYLIATIKSWNIENCEKLISKFPDCKFSLISDPKKFTKDLLESIKPDYVFLPHWSWIIPKDIYEDYNCVVFHMTDLPFGRGGSPLQNLLIRGIYQTKISAIKVCADLDAGPVYIKEPFDISKGSADEILRRASDVVFKHMIPRFLTEDLTPCEQTGEIVTFKRRTPDQSEIPEGLTQKQLYDYIRMLDGEGYPAAFMRLGTGRMLFTDATYEDNMVMSRARFVPSDKEKLKDDMQ